MISLENIMHLKLDRNRMERYENMPPPGYATKALTNQFEAIGNSTLCKLLDIDPDMFERQLGKARYMGASYLMHDKHSNVIGVSAATSLIKDGEITNKNLILPKDMAWKRRELSEHYIMSIFVTGNTSNGILSNIDDIAVAGWLPSSGINEVKVKQTPPNFRSKLPVVMVPCKQLRPISTLIPELTDQSLHI